MYLRLFAAPTLVVCAALLVASPAVAQRQHRGGLARMERTFIAKATEGGIAEVELGRLASERGESAAIKEYGERMVTDHSKANDELRSLASSKGLSEPTGLSAKDRKLHDRLSHLSGPRFDRAYIAAMVKDHTHDVAEFRREAGSGGDTDIREWARRTLPTLEEHLRMARDVANATRPHEHRGRAR